MCEVERNLIHSETCQVATRVLRIVRGLPRGDDGKHQTKHDQKLGDNWEKKEEAKRVASFAGARVVW